MTKIPVRCVPTLKKSDKKKQRKSYVNQGMLIGKVNTIQEKVDSFKSKVSPHVVKARKIYGIDKIGASNKLAKKTGCSRSTLAKIKKGQGAYFSSGSRPNQTGHSWGRARLASSITGGKAAAVDYNILKSGCTRESCS